MDREMEGADMTTFPHNMFEEVPWEEDEVSAAARDAAAIGGRAGDEYLDPALRPLVEGGEGVAEGFELAEDSLIAAAEYGDPLMDPLANAFTPELGGEPMIGSYGEADHEASSELRSGET
jgi:hypothetical protein